MNNPARNTFGELDRDKNKTHAVTTQPEVWSAHHSESPKRVQVKPNPKKPVSTHDDAQYP